MGNWNYFYTFWLINQKGNFPTQKSPRLKDERMRPWRQINFRKLYLSGNPENPRTTHNSVDIHDYSIYLSFLNRLIQSVLFLVFIQHFRFPRPASASGSPALSRQVSEDEDDEDTDFRLNPYQEDSDFNSDISSVTSWYVSKSYYY